jgi:hypothetical protein
VCVCVRVCVCVTPLPPIRICPQLLYSFVCNLSSRGPLLMVRLDADTHKPGKHTQTQQTHLHILAQAVTATQTHSTNTRFFVPPSGASAADALVQNGRMQTCTQACKHTNTINLLVKVAIQTHSNSSSTPAIKDLCSSSKNHACTRAHASTQTQSTSWSRWPSKRTIALLPCLPPVSLPLRTSAARPDGRS